MTGTTQARQRIFLVQAKVFDHRTISRGLDKPAIVQARYKQSPNEQYKSKLRQTENQTTRHYNETRLELGTNTGLGEGLRNIAITA